MAKTIIAFAGQEVTGTLVNGVFLQDNTQETRGLPRRAFVSTVSLMYLPRGVGMGTAAALQRHGVEYVPAEGYDPEELERLNLPEDLQKVVGALFVWPNSSVLTDTAKAARRRR